MEKLFHQPQMTLDISMRVLCWGVLVLNRLAYAVLYPIIPPEYRTPYILIVQGLLIGALTFFAVAPALRDIRDMLVYELIWLLIWNGLFFLKSDYYDPNWFALHLIGNWMTLLAAIRIIWFPGSAVGSIRTDWPIFGIIGFCTRHRYKSHNPATYQSGALVWSLIIATYPAAWYITANKINFSDFWLFILGTIIITVFGKSTAFALRDHVKQSLQTQADLADIVPQFESLKASLASSAANHPPIRTREEVMVAMQKWLSEDERTVLDAMRKTHPDMIQPLVDGMINLAGNRPRPGLTLVHSKEGE